MMFIDSYRAGIGGTIHELYFNNFEDETLGVAPAGWTVQWDAVSWTVVSGKRLQCQTPMTNAYRAISAPVGSTVANAEMKFKAQFSAFASSFLKSYAAFRCSGAASSENGYIAAIGSAEMNANGTEFTIYSLSSGTANALDSIAFAASSATWYWIGVRAIGSTLQAGIWADGSPEPDPWQISIVDATHANGWWGVGARTRQTIYGFDNFSLR